MPTTGSPDHPTRLTSHWGNGYAILEFLLDSECGEDARYHNENRGICNVRPYEKLVRQRDCVSCFRPKPYRDMIC